VQHAIAWVLVVRALRDRLGLRRVRWAGCGAAPVATDVLQFFMGLGVPVHEVYGMTENTASATANRPGRIRLGTVGEPHDAVELRIDETTGEVLTRGPATFLGYWKRPDATAEAVDADGWLHTGDVGVLEDGRLRITDRMKDILITAGGKNIAPSEIENAVKVSPMIKEAVVIGDRRPYLVALIGIEPDTVSDWAQRNKISFTTYRDLTEKPEVVALVQAQVDEVNANLATVEQIKAFRLLPKLLDHEDGELTATQKVRRSALAERFGPLVEGMYSRGSAR
jgi:long-chain acyl-CoA synthetase